MYNTRKDRVGYGVLSLILLMLGICLIVWPGASAQTLCILAGAAIALFGLTKLIQYFRRKEDGVGFQLDFATGVLGLMFGVMIIAFSRAILGAIPVFLGIFILLDGVFKLQTAMDSRRFGLPGWWGLALFAAAVCILGIYLIVRRYESVEIMAMILGIALLLDGVQNLGVMLYAVRKRKRDAKTVRYEDVDE